jgi:hypothetical protein
MIRNTARKLTLALTLAALTGSAGNAFAQSINSSSPAGVTGTNPEPAGVTGTNPEPAGVTGTNPEPDYVRLILSLLSLA